MESPQQEFHVSKPMLLGLLVGTLFGAILFYLFRRQQALAAPQAPINIWNFGPGSQVPMQALATPAQPIPLGLTSGPTGRDREREHVPSVLQSFNLSSTATSKLFYAAHGKMWTVQIRTVGPPGSLAYIAIDAPGFMGSPPDIIATVIPSGHYNEIKLQAGQSLYAGASVDGTVVSISASVER